MADNILKLKVDSDEYNNKLKTAGEQLKRYIDGCRKAGGTLEYVDEGVQDFIKGLGQMETKATSARGKLSEMTKVFTDMKLAYLQMTDAEKQSEPGKALSASLDQLKGRIADAKKDLADVNKELGETGRESQSTGNILDQLAGKFGISTKALMGWGAAIGAGTTALKVAKDAFFASEQNLDDWNRMVYSSQSTYEAFLTSLNTGDVSGFLDRIGQITQAAFDAYNAIDRLQTMKTIQSPQVAKKQAEVQRMEMMLRTGRYVAPVDGRTTKEGLKTGDILTDAQKKNIAAQLASGMKEIAALTKNEVQASTEAINRLYEEQALRLGMSNEEFKKGTASMAAFDSAIEKARKYQEFEAQHTSRTQMNTSAGVITQNVRDNAVNPFERYKNWSVFKDDGKLYQEIVNLIKQRSQQESQYYGELGRAYRSINRAEGVRVGGTGSTTSQTDQEKAQAKYDQAQKDYSQALEQAKMEVDAGRLNAAEVKKKELAAEEALWKSIVDAREIYDDPKFKEAQENVAAKVVELGGSVNALVEEQKKAQEAARKLTAAQEKAATAYQQMQVAQANNDLKTYNTALKQYQTAQEDVQRIQTEFPNLPKKHTVELEYIVTSDTMNVLDELKKIEGFHFDDKTMSVTFDTAEAMRQAEEIQGYKFEPKQVPVAVEQPKPVQVPVEMSYTDNNMSAFLSSLKERIAQEDIGSTLYNNLTAQLADANALANLMQTAIKNGIDISQFNPQDLWKKVFGENPGDYIEDAKWQELRKKIEELVGKPITIDVNTGTVNVNGNGSKDEQKKNEMHLGQIVNNVQSITRSLNDLGVEIPEGLTKVISTMNIITTILTTINTLAGISASTSILKSIPVIGWFLQNGGVVHAAEGWSGIVPGNSFSGDNIPALLNSGELVLNKAQSGIVATALNGIENGGFEGRSIATIESDQIRIVLQNGAQAKGMTISEYLGIG